MEGELSTTRKLWPYKKKLGWKENGVLLIVATGYIYNENLLCKRLLWRFVLYLWLCHERNEVWRILKWRLIPCCTPSQRFGPTAVHCGVGSCAALGLPLPVWATWSSLRIGNILNPLQQENLQFHPLAHFCCYILMEGNKQVWIS